MRAEAILGKKDAIPENDSSDPCHILTPLRAGTALPVMCQLIANKLPTQSIKLLWYRFSITSMPIPSPNHPHYHSWFGCKSERRSEWPGGSWERCRAPRGPFGADLLHGGCASAILLFRSKTLWADNAFCHRCIQDLKQLGLRIGASLWAPILTRVILITKISLKRPGKKGFFATFWIFFKFFFSLLDTSNKLLGNKRQMENNRSNYKAGWMFHFKYYCLCKDIQHGCVIAKRNMHWSLYQETGMSVLCKYYFIYCQHL